MDNTAFLSESGSWDNMVRLSTKHFPGVSFLVDKSFECENASENAAARFDLVHNPSVPYLTDSKFTPFSAPSRGRLYAARVDLLDTLSVPERTAGGVH